MAYCFGDLSVIQHLLSAVGSLCSAFSPDVRLTSKSSKRFGFKGVVNAKNTLIHKSLEDGRSIDKIGRIYFTPLSARVQRFGSAISNEKSSEVN